ncbi:c-type cytochrome [Desulforhopalus singaporensis]|uniref:Cytochrome C oxidase, cbb3-type, subunit III n=1 Tax=Desulforhopalus singaporensis TaxID=91360 RepID=A0A1H0LXW9_9BACT|nr:c-type cytochrome [Desulforhopalus singaporensis]SDO72770.1 Cytochrome C oxidase, cbb3-type, subunit III [Desulforhopalus singaporensis]
MNYPVWYLPQTGGGLLIALIAVLHVFVSHFAVGGGLYLIYSERKGLKENSRAILDFTAKHARFFLLITMVFGSITGVGIWFIIALVNPAATSLLIHNFVFGWAAEWVFFVVEIAAAFVYYYMFGRMDPATHQLVGWLYFIAAWLSLFLINGIIGVMLTPGEWAVNMNFWVGFFNPSFWPSLFFRTFLAILIAACYGYFSAAFYQDEDVSTEMTAFSAKWGLASLVLAIPSGLWYLSVLPEPAYALVAGKSPTIAMVLPWGVAGALVLAFVMLGTGVARPKKNLRPAALLALVSALAVMGSFEWIREAARRPYVINSVMFSNGIMADEAENINRDGFLRSALFVENNELTRDNVLRVGEELYINQCYACHTRDGGSNDIAGLTEKMSFRALNSYIGRIHEVRYFMPPFVGTKMEQEALAAYITGGIHGRDFELSRETDSGKAQQTGPVLFEENCSSCHEHADLKAAMEGLGQGEIETLLGSLDEISDEMVPFGGSEAQRRLLAGFLAQPGDGGEQAPPGAGDDTGRMLFENNCMICHQQEELMSAVEGQGGEELVRMLKTLDEISDEMQPFSGTDKEQRALANYLESLNQGGQ